MSDGGQRDASANVALGDFIAGGLGGLACVVTGQPLDTLKVKLQTHPDVYRSLWSAGVRTLAEEGPRGFYAGCTPAVVSSVAENAVLFLCYGQCVRLVQWLSDANGGGNNFNDGGLNRPLGSTQKACAGALASVVSSIAINPADRIKAMLQVSVALKETKLWTLKQQQELKGGGMMGPGRSSITTTLPTHSAWSVTRRVLREEGVRGMFRGLTSTWLREVPGYFFFFGGYSFARAFLADPQDRDKDLGLWRMALAGGFAGCCFWTSIFPIDVVRARIQVIGEYSNSFWVTLRQILKSEGAPALYNGLLPAVIRSFPANAALFVTYEYSRQFFDFLGDREAQP